MLRQRGLGFVFCFALLAEGAWAQALLELHQKPAALERASPHAGLRIDSSLVLVPVVVCDAMNRLVTGLERQDFRVFDESVEQTVTQFGMEDEPVAVGLVFDTSGSMANKLRLARQAAAAFFKTANPEDEFFLVEFNDKPRLVVPLTRSAEDIQTELQTAQAKGRTALMDAVVLALHEMKHSQKTRKALLIISDGGDNCSRYTAGELKELVRENDALIYAVGVYGGGTSIEEAGGPALLREIGEQTGGRPFAAVLSDLPDIASKIGIELRNRYLLAYSPTNQQRDGRYHAVQVKVIQPRGLPPLRAYWRRGYYAPD